MYLCINTMQGAGGGGRAGLTWYSINQCSHWVFSMMNNTAWHVNRVKGGLSEHIEPPLATPMSQ